MPSQTSTTLNGVTTDTTQTYTRNEVGAYTRTLKRTETGDPEYDETDTQSAGGSGKDENNGTGSTGGTTTFSAPSYIKGRYAITVVYTPTSGTPTTTVVPDWFPGNGLPGPLATEQRSDVGKAVVPKECGSTAGQTGVEIQDTVTDLDVVRGIYSETHMQQWVVAGEGRVCTYSTELINTYDNRVTGDLLVSERFSTLTALTGESLGQILRGRT
jgi:isocitrate lyase